jgi:hypothetical protein
MVEVEKEYASKGVAGAGLGLGIAGTALGLLNGGNLGGILGGGNNRCHEDHCVNRYEAEQAAKLADAESKLRLLESNIYTDSKIADVYERLNTKIAGVEAQLCTQAVVNAQVTANLSCLQNTVATLSGLTKTIVPITSICPTPMKEFNSWVAPNTTTTAAG